MFQISRGVAKIGAFVLVVATLGLASPMLPSAQATGAVPGPPLNVAVSDATATSLDVSWSAPMSDGGSAITDYKVEYRNFIDSAWLEFTHDVSTATSITVTGLSVDSQYQFRVSAVNSVGTGPYGEQIIQVGAAGGDHSCAVAVDGTVKCWGKNTYGQLGNNSTVNSQIPVTVSNIDGLTSGTSAVSVNASSDNFSPHTCAVMRDGTVWCWGKSDTQLGDGQSTQSSIPVKVSNIDGLTSASTAVSVDVGYRNACALMQNGIVKCWGIANALPTNMSGITGATTATTAVDLSVGRDHSCVAMANGAAKCWGSNALGQLGNPYTMTSATPVAVSGLDGSTTAKTVVRVNVSAGHSCAVIANGTVKCWGRNYNGEFGNNTTTGGDTPVAVSNIDGLSPATTAVSIAIGGDSSVGHSCALMGNHAVKCWGYNVNGQVGNGERGYNNGSTRRVLLPQTVFGLIGSTPATSALALSASDFGTCALLKDSTVVCWGSNSFGNLGNNSDAESAVPVQVTFPFASGRTLVATSVPHAPRDVATSNVTTTSVDLSWSVPVSDGGFAVTDYVIEYRQPSNSAWSEVAHTPSTDTSITITGLEPDTTYEFRVSAVNSAGTGPWQEMVKSLAASGGNHFCAVMVDGAATCWGWNANGQLGNGSTTHTVAAVPVTGIDGSSPAATAVSVVGGYRHSCAVMADGTVKCWGLNDAGQLGNDSTSNSSVPVSVLVIDGKSPGATAVSVSVGMTSSCAQMADGTARCWGRIAQSVEYFTAMSPSATVVDLDTDWSHSCVAMLNGIVRCWGTSGSGRLGDDLNTATGSSLPSVVAGIDGSIAAKTAVEVALGESSSCARMANGTLRCWGGNNSGQLGDGTKLQRNSPVVVSDITGVDGSTTAVDVSAGGGHVCAVMANGTVKCWGAGFVGLLGNGTTTESLIPVNVSGITGATPDTSAVGISASRYATCALMGDADVKCWGATGFRDSNFETFSLIPTRVPLVYTQARTVAVPAPDAPGEPTVVAGDGQASVTVVPAAGGTSPTSYTISVAGDPTKFCTVTNPAVSLSCVVPGLSNGTSYTFVVAANAYGLSSDPSSPSAPVTPVAPPSVPGAPTVVAGNGQVTVTVVRAVGGTPATSFTISVVGLPGKSCTVSNPAVSLSCVVSGLTNGTAYKFIAVANANGISSANSAQSASATPRAPAAVPPGKPLNVVITDRSAQTLELSWDAPSSPGSSAITGYTVAWREVGAAWVAGNTQSATALNAAVTGLTASKSYEIRVSATNATLTGAWSASTTGIVPAKAAAPQNVKGIASGLKITLTWSKVTTPSHSPVLKYSMYCAVGLENPARAQVGPTITTATLTVTQRKLYVCRVAAVTAAGRGTDSAPIRVTVK